MRWGSAPYRRAASSPPALRASCPPWRAWWFRWTWAFPATAPRIRPAAATTTSRGPLQTYTPSLRAISPTPARSNGSPPSSPTPRTFESAPSDFAPASWYTTASPSYSPASYQRHTHRAQIEHQQHHHRQNVQRQHRHAVLATLARSLRSYHIIRLSMKSSCRPWPSSPGMTLAIGRATKEVSKKPQTPSIPTTIVAGASMPCRRCSSAC